MSSSENQGVNHSQYNTSVSSVNTSCSVGGSEDESSGSSNFRVISSVEEDREPSSVVPSYSEVSSEDERRKKRRKRRKKGTRSKSSREVEGDGEVGVQVVVDGKKAKQGVFGWKFVEKNRRNLVLLLVISTMVIFVFAWMILFLSWASVVFSNMFKKSQFVNFSYLVMIPVTIFSCLLLFVGHCKLGFLDLRVGLSCPEARVSEDKTRFYNSLRRGYRWLTGCCSWFSLFFAVLSIVFILSSTVVLQIETNRSCKKI